MISSVPYQQTVISDLAYAQDHPRQKLDLRLTSDHTKPTPCVLLLHGGGWCEGDKSEMQALSKMVVSLGCHCAVVNYRLSSHAPYPAALHDVKEALQWLASHREELGFNTGVFLAMGVSAGAYLALRLAMECPDPKSHGTRASIAGVISIVGPANISKIYQTDLPDKHALWNEFFLGDSDDGLALIQEASVTGESLSQMPACLLVHGDNDELVPVEQAVELYCELVEQQDVTSVIRLLEGYGHAIPKEVFFPLCETFIQERWGYLMESKV